MLHMSAHVFTCLHMSSHVFTCLHMSSHVFTCLHRVVVLPPMQENASTLVSLIFKCTHRVLKRTSEAPNCRPTQNVVDQIYFTPSPPHHQLVEHEGPVHTIGRSPLHHPRVVFVSVILLQTMLIFVARSALNKQVHEIWFEPEDSPSPRGESWINLQQIIGFSWLVYATFLWYRWNSVEQYQAGGRNAPLSGFDRLGTFSWWPFSPKILSPPVTWVFLCSLGGTMSRVFVRIHWCWRCVAVPMAPGTGHRP